MTQTSTSSDVLGGGDLPQSKLWEDLQALMVLSNPNTLPLPADRQQAA
jgi:hypothetical protein